MSNREQLYNVGVVHSQCAAKPGGFTGQDPATFVGKVVKLGFDNRNPTTNKPQKEHMWVKVERIAEENEFPSGEQLVGILDNDPILICDYECGDPLAFSVSEIEDVM